MLFAWIVPAAVWLLVHFTAEVCIEGNVTPPKVPHGTVETCDDGNMTANMASPVQPGTNVTLSCQLNPLQHTGPCRTVIFLNSSELIRSYGSAVSTTFLVRTYGKHRFTCKIVCEQKKKLICGIEIESGNPPDEPRNVSCIQNGTDGHPTCTWDKGRLTYLSTTYVIQLSNGTDVFCASEESPSEKSGSLALSKLNFDSTYTLVVAASNELGSASSQPLVFMLIDIVKPHLLNFSVEFKNSATNCTLSWHAEAGARHCRLRYRPLTRHTWNMVESLSGEKCSLYGLEPHTDYEFHLSCKIHPERGLWSNWHVYQARTPEAVPTRLLDVWYRQQDVDNQRQNISLFWKALSRSEAGGRILQYRVTFEALGQQRSPAGEDITNHTSYTRVTPRVGYKITVTAENSRGRSPPASIVTSLGTQGLPPPQEVSAVAMGNSSILVSWKPPAGLVASSLGGYVVEWTELGRDTHPEPQHAWVKLPASNLSTVITEHIKDNVCYQISVFALYGDGAGQGACVRGHSRAEAPAAGPQVYATPRANGILVSWAPIPAHQQRGCITGYHVYLQKKDREEAPAIYAISNTSAQHWLLMAHLQPGDHYALWMTASTAAGEGPRGNSELLSLESAGEWVTVVLTCSFFIFSACICSAPPARKVLHSLLSALVPQWQDKAIPDPANAAWAKNYLSTKAELSSPSSPFISTSSFEEPETTQVEEAFVKGDPPDLRDQLLLGTGHQGGGRWPLASSSGQEPEYEGDAEGDPYEQQLPDLYKRMAVEVTEQTQSISEYIANPVTTYSPPVTRDHPELEGNLLSMFPTVFLMPYEGNLTLDVVKLNSSSFSR
ncbi:interleukin-12 receptor subunit beta-2 [Numenius arquata]|uniref:interleukin-12 receptor subunit beta-2 n=1 Tax=Numenius arquata TaxID=31919 RepID=UPI003D30A0EF